MAEPYQPISVNPGSAQQAIQSTPNATPALGDLMSSIKEGFISADDIRRRVQSGPLEAATRAQDMADVQQVRPLQRQAEVANLENIQAKQKIVAESLPILQATGRITLAQDFENAKQNGAPDAILKSFYASVPGLIPWSPEKLTDPKTGQLNLAYAIDMTQKAHQAAAKIASSKPIVVKRVDVDATGRETTSETATNPLTGEAVGVSIPTGVKEVNVVERDTKAAAAAAGLSNDVLKERNSSDLIKRYIPQASSFEAINEIRYRNTPPKNADDLAILYQFIRILDPTSVVREGEKKFAESTAPGAQELWNKIQGIFSDSNKTMDADTRKNLYATIDSLESGAEKTVLPELKRISLLALDRGMPLDQALTGPEIKLLVSGPSVPGQPTPPVPGVAGAVPTGENPVVTPEQARTLPPTTKFFRLVAGGPLAWNPNHPDSPTQKRLRTAAPAATVTP